MVFLLRLLLLFLLTLRSGFIFYLCILDFVFHVRGSLQLPGNSWLSPCSQFHKCEALKSSLKFSESECGSLYNEWSGPTHFTRRICKSFLLGCLLLLKRNSACKFKYGCQHPGTEWEKEAGLSPLNHQT